ncbi:NAD(P)H-hydrate dehydratase [Phycisphaera mikurensis]|uniref:ADP-dependent (S)-NAD(P)H-hydrate dehydratase n=1 Tax=Phycisphaera mikurensis (strain NBRC 102666 / KCTC 22515 / FYK2301M01) TaxID=1142394 RepID=I0IE41_PHYMF|nr:NAD(P)H-hydrate dehydratase [Phycisphaera mikurensis]MBB6441334.1 NAD(P)H-hydrate epimerase [Phycisphaera mikurensis]BAM03529.1 hypothetical protein PSMK_13700 [Phycisphaera mikurensis NBRC 102666]
MSPPLPDPPDRPADGHKGTFGTVIVLGGSEAMIGAPALAAGAALRGGAGLVKLAVPAAVLPHALGIEPSATGVPLPADASHWPAALDAADPDGGAVLAVGPGLGDGDRLLPALDGLLDGPRPLVLDADGLNALAASGRRGAGPGRRVLTPHPGEFRRLARALGLDADPIHPDRRGAAAAELARAHGCTVVLKGRETRISDGEREATNTTGNPALATAGTGDVLTGLLAGLLAQGMATFEAARLAAHAHGAAADAWAAGHGPAGLKARDLADRLPAALRPVR